MENSYHYVVAIAPKNAEEINDKYRVFHELGALCVAIENRNLSYVPKDTMKVIQIGSSPVYFSPNKISAAENIYRIDVNPRLNKKEIRGIKEKLKNSDVKIFRMDEL